MQRTTALVLGLAIVPAGFASTDDPHWIWYGAEGTGAERWFRHSFELGGSVARARLIATADNHLRVFLNGERVLAGDDWTDARTADVRDRLGTGRNVIAVWAENDGGPAGVVARLAVELRDGTKRSIVTSDAWKASDREADGWREADFDDAAWARATSLGVVGAAGLPWTGTISAETFGAEPQPIEPQPARADESIRTLPGFEVELLFEVPKSLGSWVSMTTDPRGRLIVSDQSRGLYRVTPAVIGAAASETEVERIDVSIGGAQGLLWAFDSLYVSVNGGDSGLYRVRDTDGDDRLDEVEQLAALRGNGEHGPHAILLAPDGESLFVAAGNHTDLPEIASSRLPSNWGEDLLLPRHWDARGHARGRMAPGGWICEVDPDGARWTVHSAGYRNEYDMAFNPDGELFVFDADMEWDMGLPWYRPTRVCHAVSGSEFGWRAGTGKWPTSYPDSLPAVVDIGPGSPTGVVFGTGARFPAEYQRALFIMDWTFGTMYAVHVEPDGASYTGTKEEFLSGRPLPLTDLVIGADGAMYFLVGGRGLASSLFRVRYVGEESTEPVAGKAAQGVAARAERRALERFHARRDPRAVETAWPRLAHDDRFVRYAARLAIEAQPPAEWRDRALAETDPQAALEALLALARQGDREHRPRLLDALGRLEWSELTDAQRIALLRVYALTFIRAGRPDDATVAAIAARVDPRYPTGRRELDAELVCILVYLNAPSVVDKTIPLLAASKDTEVPAWGELIARNDRYGGPIARMLEDMPPLHGIHLAFVLRNARTGWSSAARRAYFTFLNDASKHPGGESYAGFLRNIRSEVFAQCSEAERREFAELADRPLEPSRPAPVIELEGPGRVWTVEAATRTANRLSKGRDFDRGRGLYHAVACAACHRFDGEGGAIGPDLTSLRNKFTTRDLIESLVEPSKVISDQYGSSIVTKRDGEMLFGRVVDAPATEAVLVYPAVAEPEPVSVARADIATIEASPVSQMPIGLINVLNETDLADLVAYLMSRGDCTDGAFRK